MATSVKMDDSTKARLEELQAEIRLATGRRVSQQDILARLVSDAVDSKASLIDSFRESTVPVDPDLRAVFHEGTSDWGVETTEDEVDEILYG